MARSFLSLMERCSPTALRNAIRAHSETVTPCRRATASIARYSFSSNWTCRRFRILILAEAEGSAGELARVSAFVYYHFAVDYDVGDA